MIVRMWRGIVRSEVLDEYAEIVERTGLAESRRTPGNRGAQLLTRDLGEGRSELLTLSWWDTLEDVRAFAGENISIAKYYPEDDPYLLDRDETVVHYQLGEPGR